MKKEFFAFALCILALSLNAQRIEKIWGVVTDFDTQLGIKDVEIEIMGLLQTTKTDEKGNFSLFLESPPVTVVIKYRKDGYESSDVQETLPLQKAADIRLKRTGNPTITITKVVIGNSIVGQVNGVSGTMLGKYKIVVYTYTDKYYIHPWKNSQLPLKANGEWKMGSARHPGPCPDKVLVAIVDINFDPPPVIFGILDDFVVWDEVDDISKIECK